jgi:hypothetical protein
LQRPGAPGLSSQTTLPETVQAAGKASRPVPRAFGPNPEGISDNSPTFQRWVSEFSGPQVPKGRLNTREPSAAPRIPPVVPNDF